MYQKIPKAKTCFPSPHTSISQNLINLWKCLPFQNYDTHKIHNIFWQKFHQNIFWLTNIYIQELCNLLTKLYALQSCNKSIQKYFAQLCIWDNGIVPRPSPSLVLTMILDYCSGLSLIHHIIVPDFHTQTNK